MQPVDGLVDPAQPGGETPTEHRERVEPQIQDGPDPESDEADIPSPE